MAKSTGERVGTGGKRVDAAPGWSTALVTGASSGIGEAVARELARSGVDLVVVARDVGRLEALADELGSEFGVQVEVLAADLGSPVARAAVEKRLARPGAPIDLLVNNAGFGTSGAFVELPVAREEQEIQLNVVALTRLSAAAARSMLARGRGHILNISSIAGSFPSPGSATYGATKAFVTSFSEALHEELAGSGVVVTVSLPGFTRTEFQQRAGSDTARVPRRAWLSAEQVAVESLAATRAGRTRIVPGRRYRWLLGAASVIPDGIRRRVVARVRAAAR